jgi:RNAse (barnase) inhibitor barstar
VAGVGDEPQKFTLDGRSFNDLAGFYEAIGATLGTQGWGRNLDAFNDILRGGFGTPEEGFVLRWEHSAASAETLGWDETIRYLQRKLKSCHPDNIPYVQKDLEAARRQEGQTLFDIIVEIIQEHGPGGREHGDNVQLVLA